jgi:tRNA (uracil-5-)-methyltransferase
LPTTFSNDFLLKMEVHDAYCTSNALKKHLLKQLPNATQPAPAPLFRGLTRIGKNPSCSIAYFNFDTEEDRTAARDAMLAGAAFRSRKYTELPITEQDLAARHRGAGVSSQRRPRCEGTEEAPATEGGAAARAKAADKSGDAENPNVAPWSTVPYDQQLARKATHCRKVLRIMSQYHHSLDEEAVAARKAMMDGTALFVGEEDQAAPVEEAAAAADAADAKKKPQLPRGVIPSPVIDGYRNNVQLTAGFDVSGAPMLGFMVGAVLDGCAAVAPADTVRTSHPAVAPLASLLLQQVILPLMEQHPALTVYSKQQLRGFWRRFQFRLNEHNECMLDVEVDPAQAAPEAVEAARAGLIATLCGQDVNLPCGVRVVSLQWHFYSGTSVAGSEVERIVIAGAPTLRERLLQLHFDISPGDFFQVNRGGTERLMETIRARTHMNPDRTILLDLCSGTGTLGLVFAASVKRIIGIELVATAVDNARRNAAANGITNAEYHCGKVEEVLPGVMRELATQAGADTADIVAILDPPRCGVHGNVLRALRNALGVRTLVYVSCDQRALERDCEALTKPPTLQFYAKPFTVRSAFGVDLFPHTPHCEMIAVMTRKN